MGGSYDWEEASRAEVSLSPPRPGSCAIRSPPKAQLHPRTPPPPPSPSPPATAYTHQSASVTRAHEPPCLLTTLPPSPGCPRPLHCVVARKRRSTPSRSIPTTMMTNRGSVPPALPQTPMATTKELASRHPHPGVPPTTMVPLGLQTHHRPLTVETGGESLRTAKVHRQRTQHKDSSNSRDGHSPYPRPKWI